MQQICPFKNTDVEENYQYSHSTTNATHTCIFSKPHLIGLVMLYKPTTLHVYCSIAILLHFASKQLCRILFWSISIVIKSLYSYTLVIRSITKKFNYGLLTCMLVCVCACHLWYSGNINNFPYGVRPHLWLLTKHIPV